MAALCIVRTPAFEGGSHRPRILFTTLRPLLSHSRRPFFNRVRAAGPMRQVAPGEVDCYIPSRHPRPFVDGRELAAMKSERDIPDGRTHKKTAARSKNGPPRRFLTTLSRPPCLSACSLKRSNLAGREGRIASFNVKQKNS